MTADLEVSLAQWATRLVVLAPFLAALVGLIVARHRSAARVVAMTGSIVALVAAGYVLWHVHSDQQNPWVTTVGPLPVGALDVPLHLVMDDLSAIVAVVVALVGTLIQAYTRAYLHADPRYGVFAASVSLFLAGMLLVVVSRDLVLTLVGWEVMGWCSYLLIGHHSRRASANRAALKAFLVTRFADLAFVLGIVILAGYAGTTDIAAVVDLWSPAADCPDTGMCAAPDSALLSLAMLGLLCGIAGKSGLIPFHDWLPDAMEGPTPASALIHAATMVAAGTYVLARLFPLFAQAPAARLVLAVLATATMVYAALLAFAQSDLKRLLAYSTLSQIAIMLAAVAVAPVEDGPGAGVFHLLSHALWKALLFLAIGWVAVLVGGTSALVLRGSVRWHPAVRLPVAIGLLSLAGFPPMVGFVSKEYVLAAAQQGAAGSQQTAGVLVVGGLVVTIFLTAAYCTRAWILLQHLTIEEEAALLAATEPDLVGDLGDPAVQHEVAEVTLEDLFTAPTLVMPVATGPVPDAPVPDAVWSRDYTEPLPVAAPQPQPQPAAPAQEAEPEHELEDPTDVHGSIDAEARFPVGVLAFLTTVGGAIVFTPMIPGIEPHLDLPTVIVSVALVVLAVAVVWLLAARRTSGDAADALGSRVRSAADRGLGVDRLYVALTRPVHLLANLVVLADAVVVDAYVRGAAVATKWAGIGGAAAHTRRPSTYLVWLLLGLLSIGVAGVMLW